MTSSSPAPAALLLSDQILQRRIDAGLAIAGGGRGSLTKALLTTRTTRTTTTATTAGTNSNNSNNSNSTAPGTLLLQLEMTKLALIVQRNELLLQKCRRQEEVEEEDSAAAKNNSTGSSSATSPPLSQRLRTKKQPPSQSQKPPPPPDTTTTTTITTNSSSSTTSMQQKLVTAKAVYGCWQSYEGLATAIVQKHAVSEAQLHHDIGIIDAALVTAQEQLQQAQATARTRAAQCHLLQQCVQDLQQSVEEEQIAKEGEPDNTVEGKKSSSKDTLDSDGDAVMKDASAVAADADGDDEEGELYGDLDSLL
jgi:hypothetical protein